MEKMTAQEIEQKRAGEKETVDCMIGIYCRGVHGTKRGELCEACCQLQAYADLRTEKCPFMETKTFCSACKVHCYSKEMQEKIDAGILLARKRLIEKTKKEDGELVVVRDGKVVRVKAKDLK